MRYLFIILFASCTTQSKVTKWLDAHPVEAATYCSERFPPIITIDTITTTDTLTNMEAIIYTDSLYLISHDTIYKSIRDKIKPCVNKVITIERTVIDSAKVVVYDSKMKELNEMTKDRDDWRKWSLILTLLITIYIIIKRFI